MTAPLHWEVLAMVDDDRGMTVGLLGVGGFFERCRHQHATADDATMCPWVPDPWPDRCDLLVRQVRTPDGREPWRQGVLL